MNIVDAVKSGRPFRHKGSCQWLTKEDLEFTPVSVTEPKVLHLSISDLLADDWETQEPTVTITRSQFWNTYSDIIKSDPELADTVIKLCRIGHSPEYLIAELARKLGLE